MTVFVKLKKVVPDLRWHFPGVCVWFEQVEEYEQPW